MFKKRGNTMNKLIGQLKMQARMNKMTFLYAIMMICMTIIAFVVIGGNTIFANIAHKNNISRNNEMISIVFLVAAIQLLYIPLASAGSICQTMQMAVRMGSTRKNFHLTSVIFIVLCDFMMGITVIILLIIEHFLYKSVGLSQSIDVFNIIQFGNLNFNIVLAIFLTYFSILIALSGLFYFLISLGTTVFKGKLVMLFMVLFFTLSYLGAMFTPLKIYLKNFLVNNLGLVLYLKLSLVGVSGFVLSWPFIERLDINRLRFK